MKCADVLVKLHVGGTVAFIVAVLIDAFMMWFRKSGNPFDSPMPEMGAAVEGKLRWPNQFIYNPL